METEKHNLAEKAYQRLLDDIQQFRLAPGESISDYYLSQQLQMSRTPIRLALLRLEQEGLVETNATRKMMVSRLTIVDIREIYEAREAIECKAARLIIDHGGLRPEQSRELWAIHARLVQSVAEKNLEENFSADSSFHLRIMEYAGNSRLTAFFHRLSSQSTRARYISALSPEWFEKTIADHEDILNAFMAQDKVLLNQAITRHLEDSVENYGRLLSSLPNYAALGLSLFKEPSDCGGRGTKTKEQED